MWIQNNLRGETRFFTIIAFNVEILAFMMLNFRKNDEKHPIFKYYT
jgi:hypothetical protein